MEETVGEEILQCDKENLVSYVAIETLIVIVMVDLAQSF